jgi:hypothetical protein
MNEEDESPYQLFVPFDFASSFGLPESLREDDDLVEWNLED